MLKKGVFVVGAKRTPFGVFGGAFVNHSANDLALIAAKAALNDAKIDPKHVDYVVFGNSLQTSNDAVYLARHTGLNAGIPKEVPALIVNRLCGSGFQAVIDAAMQIECGVSKVVLAGGTESMSQAPFGVRGARFGIPLFSDLKFEDFLSQTSLDTHCNLHMGQTAETLGRRYGITRQAADEYAARSQQRWHLAFNAGHFTAEMEPVSVKTKRGAEQTISRDEHPRETSSDALAKLKPVFQPDGLVTPGNASGVSDGAAALVIAEEASVNELRLQPLARIVDWSVIGCDPTVMGIGPVGAIREIVDRSGIQMADIDLIEINEAFAAQVLAVQAELRLDPDRLNGNGGAIAVGHPLGASGARIVGHLTRELQRQSKKYALGAACVGGGQGIAVLLECV